ncbi:MAG: hypothetical protein GON13_02280 [Nanoarchaeota archaeon]|nr:hypothetical protein [Nanoarchaeota archaeon]
MGNMNSEKSVYLIEKASKDQSSYFFNAVNLAEPYSNYEKILRIKNLESLELVNVKEINARDLKLYSETLKKQKSLEIILNKSNCQDNCQDYNKIEENLRKYFGFSNTLKELYVNSNNDIEHLIKKNNGLEEGKTYFFNEKEFLESDPISVLSIINNRFHYENKVLSQRKKKSLIYPRKI